MRVRRAGRGEAGRADPRVVLKFDDELVLPPGDPAEQLERAGVAPWSRLAHVFPGIELTPLVDTAAARAVHELQRRGAGVDRAYRPARLASFFAISAPAGTPLAKLVSFLKIWGHVQRVYLQGRPVRPPAPERDRGTDRSADRGTDQGGPAPGGVDLDHVARLPGGDGAGVRLVTVDARAHVAEQIVAAVGDLRFGDVLAVDVEYADAGAVSGLPAEVYDADYEAIRLATALGVVVVAAAGTGGVDLDRYRTAAEHPVLAPGLAGFRDSGAVLVGTATPPAARRAPGSNFGARVDCYGWAGQGPVALVAEAAAAVQGVSAATRGYRFSPAQLRDVLRRTGTPSADPAADRIGVLPDLRRLVDADPLRLAPDLYLRDFVGDSGEPHTGPVTASPDVIVRRDLVADPQAAFGEGSGTEDDPTLAEPPTPGGDRYVYVRVRNQGGEDARDASATVYWTPAATLLVPSLWHEIGTAALPAVPTGDTLTVSAPLRWPAHALPPDPACGYVAVLHAAGDPAPGREAFTEWDRFARVVREHNNLAARNIHVVDNVPPEDAEPVGYLSLPCLVPGAFDRARSMDLAVSARLQQGTRLLFEAPFELLAELGLRREQVKLNAAAGTGRLPVTAHGRQPIGTAVLPAGSLRRCRLLVRLPQPPADRMLRVALRQSADGVEVGRVTWFLAPPAGPGGHHGRHRASGT